MAVSKYTKLSFSCILIFSLLLLGCASTWNNQRKQVNSAYKRGEINDEVYDFKMRKITQEEENYKQEAKENKILRQQAEERRREGYYIPPAQPNHR
ncbi:MAG: hypothetical protein PHT31_02550 [Candidatus Omnitrophica bacterium]|nr:hypothetical protein [Candidatus Omnitrophota bacterium]MDD5653028.1 hypothetical protein [Candidatus Omnitrophota bacterium]